MATLPMQEATVVEVDGSLGVAKLLGSNKQFTFLSHQRCQVLDQGGYRVLGPPVGDNSMPRRRGKIFLGIRGNTVAGWGTRHPPPEM